jgi:hypothetical protein
VVCSGRVRGREVLRIEMSFLNARGGEDTKVRRRECWGKATARISSKYIQKNDRMRGPWDEAFLQVRIGEEGSGLIPGYGSDRKRLGGYGQLATADDGLLDFVVD